MAKFFRHGVFWTAYVYGLKPEVYLGWKWKVRRPNNKQSLIHRWRCRYRTKTVEKLQVLLVYRGQCWRCYTVIFV